MRSMNIFKNTSSDFDCSKLMHRHGLPSKSFY